jgi:DNA uptake protein ComE-like DNA-binding protein
LNFPSLTPAERKVAWFVLLCAIAGTAVLAVRNLKPSPRVQEKSQKEAVEIRQRLVRADHSSATRNRTGVELNLNAASEQDLARLPALGPALAHVVFQDRAAHGPYASVSELSRVKNISPKRLKELSAFLYVLPTDALASAATNPSSGSSR